ncbi:MAG: substrate-binding domain-containing protein [Clostridiales bacterium]|jgi:phosphate transport system substrate-binding protein|nr:substrate-binding domain-containing protein [Clostridiales bacterium]
MKKTLFIAFLCLVLSACSLTGKTGAEGTDITAQNPESEFSSEESMTETAESYAPLPEPAEEKPGETSEKTSPAASPNGEASETTQSGDTNFKPSETPRASIFEYDTTRFEMVDEIIDVPPNGLIPRYAPTKFGGFVNKRGEYIIEPVYTFVTGFNEFGAACVADESGVFLINAREEVLSEKFTHDYRFSYLTNGLYAVADSAGVLNRIINSQGDEVYAANNLKLEMNGLQGSNLSLLNYRAENFQLDNNNSEGSNLVSFRVMDEYIFSCTEQKLTKITEDIPYEDKLKLAPYRQIGGRIFYNDETGENAVYVNGEILTVNSAAEHKNLLLVKTGTDINIYDKNGEIVFSVKSAGNGRISYDLRFSILGDDFLLRAGKTSYYLDFTKGLQKQYSFAFEEAAKNERYWFLKGGNKIYRIERETAEYTMFNFNRDYHLDLGANESGFCYTRGGKTYAADNDGNLIFNTGFSDIYTDCGHFVINNNNKITILRDKEKTLALEDFPEADITFESLNTQNYKTNSKLYAYAAKEQSVSFLPTENELPAKGRYVQNGETMEYTEQTPFSYFSILNCTPGAGYYADYNFQLGINNGASPGTYINFENGKYKKYAYNYEKRIFEEQEKEPDIIKIGLHNSSLETAVTFYKNLFTELGLQVYQDEETGVITASTYGYNPQGDELSEIISKITYEPPFALPIIDGATSIIPFAKLLYSSHNNVSAKAADESVNFSTTHPAYLSLFGGYAEVIMVLMPSEEEKILAEASGSEYEYIPFAKEGFVFFTNINNPVNNLSTEQIKKIYTGEITNWSEAGGNDEEILPFQRDVNSGSQTLMDAIFMKGEKMAPPVNGAFIFTQMGEIIDSAAEYENSQNAIGYSVQSFAESMHKNENVKLLSVDGVYPSRENIKSGAYGYTANYYLVLRKTQPEESNARRFAEFVLSEEGQRLAELGGLVPLN